MSKISEINKIVISAYDTNEIDNKYVIEYDYHLEKEDWSESKTPVLSSYQEKEIHELICYCQTNDIHYTLEEYVKKGNKYFIIINLFGVNK